MGVAMNIVNGFLFGCGLIFASFTMNALFHMSLCRQRVNDNYESLLKQIQFSVKELKKKPLNDIYTQTIENFVADDDVDVLIQIRVRRKKSQKELGEEMFGVKIK